MWRVWRALAVGVACLASVSARAQSADSAPPPPGVSPSLDSARAVRGARMSVVMYTYGPGNEVFERFGHIALAIRDSATGEDVAFNWGIYDFTQPHFLVNFLSGDTKYWMAGYRVMDFNAVYARDDRSIRMQTLFLPAIERAALFDYVAWNAADAHKYYRYDYYGDNCSTRIRDVLDRVLGGQLRTAFSNPGSGRTWRGETARITASDWPVYAGIEIALGRNADHVLTRWEEAFLPQLLADHLTSLVLRDQYGGRFKLVMRDSMLRTANRVPLPTEAPSRLIPALLLGLTLAGLIAAMADMKRRAARIALSTIIAVWYGVGGVLGTLLLLAATVTKHAPYMGSNITLLQLHPLLLVAAVVVPVAVYRAVRSRAALGVSVTVALLAACGALLQLLPAFAQHSGVVLAVALPVHAAIAVAVWRIKYVL